MKVKCKPSILILAAANISTCPRPMRVVEMLKDEYDVSVMGIDADDGRPMPSVEGVKSYSYPAYKRRSKWGELRLWCDVMLRRWDRLSFIPNRLVIIEHLMHHHYDVIFCHDLLLLPVLFAGLDARRKGEREAKTKVIFDAREFYPWQNTSSMRWRILFQAFNEYLCATYATRAFRIFSVSPRFCELYQDHFGLRCDLLLSLPRFYPFTPTSIDTRRIKILYHGALNQNRDIEKVIELCNFLDERFCIDFIFTGGEEKFYHSIQSHIQMLQKSGKAIRMLSPVSLNEIVPFGHMYDIGLLYIPQHNHNLCATLPNKFFEYIQSRLALLLPPIPSIMPFVEQYQNAIVAKDFEIYSLAMSLNILSAEEIMHLKNASHKAADELHLERNMSIVHKAVSEALDALTESH